MKYVLGVDAGNSKTIALVSKLDGTIVGSGRGGCGDIYNADASSPQQAALAAMQNVDAAVQGALSAAGCRADDIVYAAFSMAGADWLDDFALIENALKQTSYARHFTVVNDAVGALRAGATDHWGVCIANGTGAAISGRSPTGQTWHASWWQQGGGGRSLGVNALAAICRAELGITDSTMLSEKIVAFYGMSSVEETLYHFTKREGVRLGNVAGLARTVLDVAEMGDRIALELVCAEAVNLADYALAAARKVGIDQMPFPLVLTGSVFKHSSPLMTNTILARVHSTCPAVTVLRSELEPSAGAVIMALEGANVAVDDRIRKRLEDSAPNAEFFVT